MATQKTPLYKGPLMWRVWRKGEPDGAYWYVDAKDKEDALKQMAKAIGGGCKPDALDAKRGAK